MKVVGYARVSTAEQAQQGISLDAQEAKMRAYADLYELDLVAVQIDAGASAKSLDRPGLQQALQALDAGEAEGLLVVKLDRLTRSVKDLGSLLDRYFGTRFSLLSVSDQIDTRSAAGRLVLNVLAAVSQWEREAIGERTSAALQHKIAQGERVGAPPFGWDVAAGKLTGNAREQTTLDRIAELRAQNLTMREIADILSAEKRTTKRGARWHANTVRRALLRMEER